MSEPTQAATVAPHTMRTKHGDDLRSVCSVCPEVRFAPDKGLGRAFLAAWESDHGANCTWKPSQRAASEAGEQRV